MVSPLSLYVLAGVTLLLAAGVGGLRRTGARQALADGLVALAGALVALLAAVFLFALARPAAAAPIWGAAGSVALLASPLGAVLALRARGRRSLPRALLASLPALAGVALWLTLDLRGPRAWGPAEVAVALPAAAVALAAAACLGWWSKRRRGDEAPTSGGR